jgi:hypothetical protein
MNKEQEKWLEENSLVLMNVKLTREQSDKLYEIYNSITGEMKRPSSCGRCLQNVRKRIKIEINKNN